MKKVGFIDILNNRIATTSELSYSGVHIRFKSGKDEFLLIKKVREDGLISAINRDERDVFFYIDDIEFIRGDKTKKGNEG